MKKIAVLSTLLLAQAASADTLCSGCVFTPPGTYLGSFWKGDRASFQGQETGDLLYYVMDVNTNGTLAFQIRGEGMVVQLTRGDGSVCSNTPGAACSELVFDDTFYVAVGGIHQASLHARVTAGRYILGIAVTHTGTVTFKR